MVLNGIMHVHLTVQFRWLVVARHVRRQTVKFFSSQLFNDRSTRKADGFFDKVTGHIFLRSSLHVLDDDMSEVSLFQRFFQTRAIVVGFGTKESTTNHHPTATRSLSSFIRSSLFCHNFNLAKSKPIRHPSPFHIDHKSNTMKLSLLTLVVWFFANCCIGVESVSSKASIKAHCGIEFLSFILLHHVRSLTSSCSPTNTGQSYSSS